MSIIIAAPNPCSCSMLDFNRRSIIGRSPFGPIGVGFLRRKSAAPREACAIPPGAQSGDTGDRPHPLPPSGTSSHSRSRCAIMASRARLTASGSHGAALRPDPRSGRRSARSRAARDARHTPASPSRDEASRPNADRACHLRHGRHHLLLRRWVFMGCSPSYRCDASQGLPLPRGGLARHTRHNASCHFPRSYPGALPKFSRSSMTGMTGMTYGVVSVVYGSHTSRHTSLLRSEV